VNPLGVYNDETLKLGYHLKSPSLTLNKQQQQRQQHQGVAPAAAAGAASSRPKREARLPSAPKEVYNLWANVTTTNNGQMDYGTTNFSPILALIISNFW
jgi:hypothetical protein